MKVPVEKSDGLYLKFFVLKLDDPDARKAARYFSALKGNVTLLKDLEKLELAL
jgi:hypothetical protein